MLYPFLSTRSLHSCSSDSSLQFIIWSHLLLMLIHWPSAQVNSSSLHPDSFSVMLYGWPLLHSNNKYFTNGAFSNRWFAWKWASTLEVTITKWIMKTLLNSIYSGWILWPCQVRMKRMRCLFFGPKPLLLSLLDIFWQYLTMNPFYWIMLTYSTDCFVLILFSYK